MDPRTPPIILPVRIVLEDVDIAVVVSDDSTSSYVAPGYGVLGVGRPSSYL